MLAFFTLLAMIGGACTITPVEWKLHEKRETPISGKRLDGNAVIPIRIALTQSSIEHGYDFLMAVSDPDSPSFSQHWTTEQVHKQFAPRDESVSAVTRWLEQHGIDGKKVATSASGGWIGFDMRVVDAERLLSTRYYEHQDDNGDLSVACNSYYLPAHVSDHVDFLLPGIDTSSPMEKITRNSDKISSLLSRKRDAPGKEPYISPTDLSTCGRWITPACLKALYSIPKASLNQTENILGVFAFANSYDQKDIDLYFSHFAPWVPNGTHPLLTSINGGQDPVSVDQGGEESVIDLDLALSLLYPQDVTVYQTAESPVQSKTLIQKYGPAANLSIAAGGLPLVEALNGNLCTEEERRGGADCGTVELTKVFSVSYGSSELQVPERAANRICTEFMKLALAGHTILFASQDQGVAQRPYFTILPTFPPTNGCINPRNISSSALSVNGTIFNPTFPATCPFVTAVGATQLVPGDTAYSHERAMFVHSKIYTPDPSLYTISSGGGVSNYFPVPEYQRSVVEEYFEKHSPRYPTYNYTSKSALASTNGIHAFSGRSVPDLSANGAHMALFYNGTWAPYGEAGTSLSTPIVASIITLINQQRTLAGKNPVGFINPTIYKHPDAFNDITHGTNPGCGTDGFPASEGWDPITGLGTPDYEKLLRVFMGLP